MAKITKVTARYVRTASISQEYGSIQVGGEAEIEIEEGEDPNGERLKEWRKLRSEAFDFITETIEKVAKKPTPGSRRADPLPHPARDTAQSKTPPQQQAFPDRTPLPDDAKSTDEPQYDDDGNRLRSKGFGGNDAFSVAEINEVWQLIYDVGVYVVPPDHSKQANQDRQHVRTFLRMSPLDSGFSAEQAQFTVERYNHWRSSGLTTQEAFAEVGSEYIGQFFRDDPVEAGDDSDLGDGDQEVGESPDEDQPVNQESQDAEEQPGDPDTDEGEGESGTEGA